MFQDGSTLPMAQRAYHPEEFLRSETLKLGILFSKTETSQIMFICALLARLARLPGNYPICFTLGGLDR